MSGPTVQDVLGAGLGRSERENAARSRSGVGGEWILFRLCLLDCHQPSRHLLQGFAFLEFLPCCLTSEQLEHPGRGPWGEGAQAQASALLAPAAVDARKVWSLLRGQGRRPCSSRRRHLSEGAAAEGELGA